MEKVIRFFKDEEGATAIEYALLASLIALLMIAGVTGVGKSVQSTFETINTGF